MAWSDLINQERVIEALRGAVARDRVAHAYLFYGPDGVGKRAVALEFARVLECQQGGDEACGTCTACNKVPRMIHPDVQVFFPQPTDAELEEVTERLKRLAENHYATVDFVRRPNLADPTKTSNKQAIYTVARINEDLRRTMSYRPVEGRYKVCILTDADLFRVEAANAFLKLLEEPPPRTVFILTTSRPDRLLPTILSRCQRFRFDTLRTEEIERALVDKEKIEPERAATLARMADGSYSRALELAENVELMENRQLVVDFLRLSYGRRSDRLPAVVEKLASMGREQFKGVMALLLSWVRDLVLYKTFRDSAPLINIDQAESVRKFHDNLPGADLEAMVMLIEEASDMVERNVHLYLIVKALSSSLSLAMHGAHSGKLYIPLVEDYSIDQTA